jgi:hypothetical protein
MSDEVSSGTASSRGLLTTIALLFLGEAIKTWEEGKPLSDPHVYWPAIIFVAFLVGAYFPNETLRRARVALSTWASNIWVWAVLFGMLWLYFASWTLADRYRAVALSEPSESESIKTDWPLLSRTDIDNWANTLRPFKMLQPAYIYYAKKDEDIAVAIGEAMKQAGWPDPQLNGENLPIGIEIAASSSSDQAAGALQSLCEKKFGFRPAISEGATFLTLEIGRRTSP